MVLPPIFVFGFPSPEDLSEVLAAGTKEVHEKAENTQFVKDFLRGRIRKELFKVSMKKIRRKCNTHAGKKEANKLEGGDEQNYCVTFLSCFPSLVQLHSTILIQPWRRRLKGTKTTPTLPLYISLQSCTATRPWPVTLSIFTALTGRARSAAPKPPNAM